MRQIDVWLYDYLTTPYPLPRAGLTVGDYLRTPQHHSEHSLQLRGTLRRLLSHYTDATTITTGPYGKPQVKGVYFNMAHSARYAVYAFSTSVALGVDIEAVRPHKADVHTLLHPAERNQWAALPQHKRQAAFFRLWVRKEAVLKAEGIGLHREPSSVFVGFRAQSPHRVDARWTVVDVPSPVGWAAALAYDGEESSCAIEYKHL